MKFLLDTNVCIQYLTRRSEALVTRLRQWRDYGANSNEMRR